MELEGLAVDGLVVPLAEGIARSRIRLHVDSRFDGQTPCNDFAGSWSYAAGLAFSNVIQSAVACVGPDGGGMMGAEGVLADALFAAGPFEIRRVGDRLQMSAARHVLTWRLRAR